MTRHALPVPLDERWLEERDAPLDAALVADRIAWWRAREESFRAHAPFDLEGPGARPSRDARGLSETWFPIARVRRDVHGLLRGRFDLAAIDANWERLSVLARAESWLDARRTLASLAHEPRPSRLVGRLLADRSSAEAFAFELLDPASFGCGIGRYPEELGLVAATAPRAVRAWDVGTGTGEGALDLALALLQDRSDSSVEVVGTTPFGFEHLMAQRRGRPHDRARTLAHRARAALVPEGVVRYEMGDVRREAPPGRFEVIVVAGVLGGVLADSRDVRAALATIRGALAPGGRAFVFDAFRADVKERARRLVRDAASRVGLALEPRGDSLVLRP